MQSQLVSWPVVLKIVFGGRQPGFVGRVASMHRNVSSIAVGAMGVDADG